MLAVLLTLLPAAGPDLARAGAADPVIIDTDIGDDIDDAFALALAVHDPRLEVVGVTTAFGDTAARVRLARRLLRAMGRPDIVVAHGTATADPTPFTQRDYADVDPDRHPCAPDAASFIAAETSARPGRITLLALAPMTNLAALIAANPDAYRRLRRVVMMGGSINAGYGPGPSPPAAEYNVAQAPAALAAVLQGGVALTMFPLDSTRVALPDADRHSLFAHRTASTQALSQLYDQWRAGNAWGQTTPTLFDVVPVAWVADPTLCSPRKLRIAVNGVGFTQVVPGAPNAQVCLNVPAGTVRNMLMTASMRDAAAMR